MPGCRILIVDDDVAILDLVADVLQAQGYLPLCATTGEEALLLAQQNPPDLILLDWWLPGLTGSEIAHLLRERGVQAPIVAFTAAVLPRNWVADPNVTSYFAKPFELAELLAMVERYCPPKG